MRRASNFIIGVCGMMGDCVGCWFDYLSTSRRWLDLARAGEESP